MDMDPWNWNVQDVQQFFRDGATNLVSDMQHVHLPHLDPFLDTLRENDISGAILLTSIDLRTLKDDCGVHSLGQRGAVMRCIDKLRARSAIYSVQRDTLRLQTPSSLPAPSVPTILAQEEVLPSTETVSENVRQGEVQVEDARGRKRRKLNIMQPEPLQQAEPVGSTEQITDPQHAPGPEVMTNALHAPFATDESLLDDGYMTNTKHPVDEVFYGSTKLGHEIRDMQVDADVLEFEADGRDFLDEPDFQFTHRKQTVGEVQYVYQQVRHYFNNAEILHLRRQGRGALGILPYRANVHEDDRSATVLQFEQGGNDVVAFRKSAAQLGSAYKSDETCEELGGDWSFLEEKYRSDDDHLLPIIGDSDIEDMPISEADNESQASDQAIEENESGHLSAMDASEVIDNAVKGMIDSWDLKLPKLEGKKAWTVWKMMKQSRSIREALIDSAQTKIGHFGARLNNIKSRLLASEWASNGEDLRKECEALEPTVADREEQRWMITVWKRRQEPPHVGKDSTKTGKHTSKPKALERGEPSIIVPQNDRFGVSPPPDVVMQDGNDTAAEAAYEADNEEFHTPINSPEVQAGEDSGSLSLPDDMILDEEIGNAPNEPSIPPGSNNQIEPDLLSEVPKSEPDNDGIYSQEKEEDTEDNLPSPSRFKMPRNRVAGSQANSRFRTDVVDLTGLSSDTSAPPRRPGRPPGKNKKPVDLSGDPLHATAADVDSWDMVFLQKKSDRMRILIKLLEQAGEDARDQLDHCYKRLGRAGFMTQLRTAVLAIKHGISAASGFEKDLTQIMDQAARMYMAWLHPTLPEDGIKLLDEGGWTTALEGSQPGNFTGMLCSILTKKDGKLFVVPKPRPVKQQPSSAPINISSNNETNAKHESPRNRRKREVARSKAAQVSRSSALERQKRYTESQNTDSARLVAMIASDPAYSGVEINPTKDKDDSFIYIRDKIAKRMKAHQIDGVRFLWREITADGADGGQGCILAHTMGLGKTMQTIALLAAIDEASQSTERTVRQQLPAHLRPKGLRNKRQLRMLILCPPALIQNWRKEIEYWASQQLGNVLSLESGKNLSSHLTTLRDWMRIGGVLLAGYQMFRSLVLGKKCKSGEEYTKTDGEAAAEEMMLEGPEIVIADEAHNLKNDQAGITKAASRFRSESRIGLTGTPMSNAVQEIYSLLSWVAPGYLGDSTEFKAHYTEPIEQGLYHDSTAAERRQSIMKLKVLHHEIQPKVNRANIEVLRGSLKSKTEFVLMVPLGEVQIQLYTRYVKALLSGDRTENASQVTLFAWLAVLTLLANHPRCFREKLLAPPRPPSKSKKWNGSLQNTDSRADSPSTESGSVTPSNAGLITTTEQLADADASKDEPVDEDIRALGFTDDMIQEILGGFEDEPDPILSVKVTIFLKLLEYSLECKDKVLVFSTSIPTLDYLDGLLCRIRQGFGRIDGSTPMSKRTQILEDFHSSKFNIMLVSTRAGGVGLNIQGANRVFIFDFGFNPSLEEQAVGRAYRLGQTKPVFVYRFVAGGTFETNIYNKQLFKSSLAQRVVDKKNPRRNAERNTRDYLYEPRHVPQENISEWSGKDPLVLDRLLAQHGSEDEGKEDTMIRAIRTMETLQEEAMDAPLDEEEQKEVNEQIEQSRNRPKGRKVAKVAATAPPATAAPSVAATQHGQVKRLMVPLPIPPSTYAGPAAQPQQSPRHTMHPMGGLPYQSN